MHKTDGRPVSCLSKTLKFFLKIIFNLGPSVDVQQIPPGTPSFETFPKAIVSIGWRKLSNSRTMTCSTQPPEGQKLTNFCKLKSVEMLFLMLDLVRREDGPQVNCGVWLFMLSRQIIVPAEGQKHFVNDLCLPYFPATKGVMCRRGLVVWRSYEGSRLILNFGFIWSAKLFCCYVVHNSVASWRQSYRCTLQRNMGYVTDVCFCSASMFLRVQSTCDLCTICMNLLVWIWAFGLRAVCTLNQWT